MSRKDHLHLVTKAANLYYIKKEKQVAIANRLEISQATVSRLVKEAIRENLIVFKLNSSISEHINLEEELREKYGLKDIYIVDHSIDDTQLINNLGSYTAFYLQNTLKKNDLVGVSCWSQALLSTANLMSKLDKSFKADVVQILGGLGSSTFESHAYQLTSKFAEIFNGKAYMLPAPGILDSKTGRDVLMKDSYIQKIYRLFKKLSVVLIGIGQIKQSKLLTESGNSFDVKELEILKKNNVVGDINLRFIDESGKNIKTNLDKRIMGIDLELLKKVPRRIAVAGGKQKHKAIYASLKGGFINTLITDSQTAQFLIKSK
jgi:DNA-binding transcriptional regulator LsrR (DeoR family)